MSNALVHTMGDRGLVFREIDAERERQDKVWGGPTHDDEHEAHHWCEFISDRVDEAFAYANGFDTDEEGGDDRPEYRRKLVQIAALALAAIESFDRKSAKKEPDAG